MIDHIISLSPYSKGLISTLYNNICDIIPHSLQDVRKLWENDLGEEMTDDQWETVLKLIHSSSPCARHSLIQLKVSWGHIWPKQDWRKCSPMWILYVLAVKANQQIIYTCSSPAPNSAHFGPASLVPTVKCFKNITLPTPNGHYLDSPLKLTPLKAKLV